jgi:hypothetical protein
MIIPTLFNGFQQFFYLSLDLLPSVVTTLIDILNNGDILEDPDKESKGGDANKDVKKQIKIQVFADALRDC